MNFRYLLQPRYYPITIPIALSIVATLLFSTASNQFLYTLFSNKWSVQYLVLSPLMHSNVLHLLMNSLALFFIGSEMLLPTIGKRSFIWLFIVAALASNIVNNLATTVPAIGMSGAIMGLVGGSLYRFGNYPIRLMLIHDVLPLPPFLFKNVVLTLIAIDIFGIVFHWQLFAHWAHLGGIATGLIWGYGVFKTNPFR